MRVARCNADLGAHVGEQVADRLVLPDRPAEGLPHVGVVDGHLQRRARAHRIAEHMRLTDAEMAKQRAVFSDPQPTRAASRDTNAFTTGWAATSERSSRGTRRRSRAGR